MNLGFDRDLYIQPFDHCGSFQVKLFGWKGALTVFWEPLVGWLGKKTSREEAVTEIARRYTELVHIFEKARAS